MRRRLTIDDWRLTIGMKKITEILETRIAAAIKAVSGADAPAMVRAAADARFGDYQANGVMAAAKAVKTNPRELAERVVAAMEIADICEPPEVAGPGFINLRLKDSFLAERLLGMYRDSERLGIDKAESPQTVVVDYSGPNIAKQMHVGHLRSTIIGDCIARLYDFAGHNVIRQNHIGDWGLQMGMVVGAMIAEEHAVRAGFSELGIESLEHYYKTASLREKNDEEAAKLNREMTVKLQQKDTQAFELWQKARKITLDACFEIYNSLGTPFNTGDIRGESFYADKLAGVVEELKAKGLAVESDGAVCVFPEGFKNKDGQPLPFIIQKSDGAFLYATTDLAALRFRVQALKAETVIYVTDARQVLHFQMLFAAAKMAGWVDERTTLEHVTFGTMLGEDGRPFKTRTGGTVKLKDLLDEAIERATAVVEAKNPDLPAEQKETIAKAVGVGAVKYADYANNRNSDYVFSFDKMLAMEGNTAPYMQ